MIRRLLARLADRWDDAWPIDGEVLHPCGCLDTQRDSRGYVWTYTCAEHSGEVA